MDLFNRCFGKLSGGKVMLLFVFKQQAAYEVSACLVSSEMCIRDGPAF